MTVLPTVGTKRDREDTSLVGSGENDESSSLSTHSSSFVSDGEENSDDDAALESLWVHVKATATQSPAAPDLPPPPSSAPRSAAGPLSAAEEMLQGLMPGGVKPVSHEAKILQTLESMKEELLRPVSSSRELMVVNVADESAEVMEKVLSRKIPKPTTEDSKKIRRLIYVNHSTMNYPPLEKVFYHPPSDLRQLTPAEYKAMAKELDGAKVTGRNPPPPLSTWDGTGLSDKVLEVLQKEGFAQPFAVQSLAVPVLMGGRDVIVTAKTGSGKTLAYVLPLVRHVVHQPRCKAGEGPIGLVLVPTQELGSQVSAILGKLCKAARLSAVASYGSVSLSENIKAAKSGCDAMVATPGRLLDLLTVNNGTSFRLQRVSFVVVDEADRLFDSGFIEHVEAFLKNIRPDRQLAMVSATLPRELKKIVIKHMQDPIEISVGGRPTPATNVEQSFYFFDEDVYDVETHDTRESPRLMKLLQILGEEGAAGERLILIFTQRKEEVEQLFGKLSVLGYARRIATLYSGMNPIDREFALEHFTPGNQFILIATAVAERGLDVPFLELVINYSLPDHVEAYVHRIGRTGRAGKKGRAVSFFRRRVDDDLAPELADALERSGQLVPEEMYEIAAKVRELRREGEASSNVGFYRGYRKGRHNFSSTRDQRAVLREAAKSAGLEDFLSDESGVDSDAESDDSSDIERRVEVVYPNGSGPETASSMALTVQGSSGGGALRVKDPKAEDKVAKALLFAQQTSELEKLGEEGMEERSNVRLQLEYPINDLPSEVRGKLQKGAVLRDIAENTSTTIVRKGVFFDPRYKHSHRLKDGDRPLYLLIIGKSTAALQDARRRLNAIKTEAMARVKQKSSVIGAAL